MKIIYDLDTEKDARSGIEILHNAQRYYCALWDIEQLIRGVLKYESRTIDEKLLEEIREIVRETGIHEV